MITAKEAKEIILSNTEGWGTELIPIEQSVGRTLQEDIYADRDFPPYNRVSMDGIAININDFNKGVRAFEISALQTAGKKAMTLDKPAHAIEIMTGAILSAGANVNIRYEDLEITDVDGKRTAKLTVESVKLWQNIHLKGKDKKIGDLLIKKGRKIASADVAALATVGKAKVLVSKLPKVAVISTGDELVPVSQSPEAHQIRMSNSISIQSTLNEMGVKNTLFHLLDDYGSLKVKINEILTSYDVLILSGGVSKGKADYIPDVLGELGVEKLFHKVAQRPGKPFWFGKNNQGKCVFALPGNPISTFMCYTVYFQPWLEASLKHKNASNLKAVLATDYNFKPDLTYYLQVQTSLNDEGMLMAMPVTGGGSGDLSNLLVSNAFIELPAGTTDFKAGEAFPLHPFRTS